MISELSSETESKRKVNISTCGKSHDCQTSLSRKKNHPAKVREKEGYPPATAEGLASQPTCLARHVETRDRKSNLQEERERERSEDNAKYFFSFLVLV